MLRPNIHSQDRRRTIRCHAQEAQSLVDTVNFPIRTESLFV
jgi:hypothetical protein